MVYIDLHGIGLENMGQQIFTKYDFSFPQESIDKNVIRLTNQIWKLIPMRENNEDWQKQLDTVIIQIIGLKEIFLYDPLFLELLSKLEGLVEARTFEFFRKTVFECINLIQELSKHAK